MSCRVLINNGIRNAEPRRSIVSVLFTALPIAVLSFGFWDQIADYLQSQSLSTYQGNIIEEYDFIIVGGGSAGSVLANRLTEDGNHNVLLLEAGGSYNPMQNVPMYFPVVVHTPQVDYDYYTVPQVNACMALREQRSYWPRGLGLGGSSNLNAMYYQRGNKNDYDRWAELSGSDDWKYDKIVRNFKNIEDYHGLYFNDTWNSNDGRGVYVSTSNEKKLLAEFLEAGREMGYPTNPVNGLQQAAFSPLDVTVKDGKRHSAYPAFLEPVLNRTNLRVYRYAHVLQVKLDENRRAYGVTFTRHGLQRFVRARNEIILSAGAIDSPKLLMLSGIGPRKHLEKLGIKTIVDLPVGQNLQDHIMTQVPFTLEASGASFSMDRDFSLGIVFDYFRTRSGVMSTSLTANGVAYVYSDTVLNRLRATSSSSPLVSLAETSPDIQLIFMPLTPDFCALEKFGSYREGYVSSYFVPSNGKDGFIIDVMLAKSKSRGEIKLASSDPMDRPIINPRYYSHPDDIKIMVDGLNFTVTMVETSNAFRKLGARFSDHPAPGCEGYVVRSRQYYECIARHVTMTVYHPCGTCSMGKGVNDPKAVVDHELRVINTKGLRVVDASIIPEIQNGNTNSAVYMIADKASEMILSEWKR